MKLPRQLNKSTKSMGDNTLIAILMTATTLLVSLGIVLSRLWWGDIRFTNKVLDQKDQVNSTLEQNVSALPALQENFTKLETEGPNPQEVLEALPANPEFSSFSKELEAISSLAGAQLVAVVKTTDEVDTPKQTGVPMPVPMTIQMTAIGSYTELNKFVALAEQAIRPIQVNRLVFNGAEPTVTLRADITTWWQPPTVVGNDMEVIEE